MQDRARGSHVDGSTRLMGLIGAGIAYTRSPRLHNAAAAKLGVNAVYLPFDLPAERVASFLDIAWTLGATGFNVTTPHKELVAGLTSSHGLRSVNTLYRGDTGWAAASTDAAGFALGLERLGRTLASFRHIVVIGGGGVVVALLEYVAALPAVPRISVFSRKGRPSAALAVAAEHLPLGSDLLAATLRGAGAETLLIQASSAPHQGDDLSSLTSALTGFGGVVVDLVYGKPSALYHTALTLGLAVQDGEPMLVEQARLAQQLWWGKAAGYDDLADALRAGS